MNKRIIPLIMIIFSISLWLIFYRQLPEQVPMQWGADGSVNWTASKFVALLVNNGMYILLYLLLMFSPKIDPKKNNYKQFSRSYEIMVYAILGLFLIINVVVLFKSLGYPLEINFFIPFLIGLLLMIFGNYMQTIKPNWFIGIRTPWTLDNETVWRKTHRLGGKIFIILGLILMITPFLSDQYVLPVILISVIVGSLIPMIYSFYLYRKLK
ncbi:MAG: SdpI family protein [Amphibacillus sp.]|nr:SdpI family protein [Amphibacillus sp.]